MSQERNDESAALGPRLTEPDREAVEALFEAGFDVARVDAAHRSRAAQAAALLSLLRAPAVSEAELCESDRRAIDAWLDRHADLPEPLRGRVAQLERVGALLRAGESEARGEHLIESTLRSVMAVTHASRRDRLAEPASGRRSPLRWREIVSTVAVFMLFASVAMPLLAQARERSRREVCTANLGALGRALASYAMDHKGELPRLAEQAQGPWWNVGSQASNSANLFSLARGKYVPLRATACPGNPQARFTPIKGGELDWGSLDEVSYSYRLLPAHTAWARGILVTDRSPVVRQAMARMPIYPMSNSTNHNGQNLLSDDRSVRWQQTPLAAGGDNIWLPRGISGSHVVLQGTEAPADADDIFVGP